MTRRTPVRTAVVATMPGALLSGLLGHFDFAVNEECAPRR
ncbi:endo alpha-1,4 polygalactosaminidase [Streptomyces galbus]|uniref:Endo alpha-1,4 polygalactosaminidase n=1 Tax=Streptomyces galbus TaxID=33898 RepID=A0A4U5X1M5_STRGB|nr:endo alpha-1,4 polygalactosaminidase [Streptomyces galbus]TKT08610.1 endo alpha-1,4 polygalactosaminidase [Streptomyces galbus]